MGNREWEIVTIQVGLTLLALVSVGAGLWVVIGADHVGLINRVPVALGLHVFGCLCAAGSVGIGE